MRLIFILSILLFYSPPSFSQSRINERFELIRLELENKYRSVGQFDSLTGIATVYDNMKTGYVDTLGKIIFPIGDYVTRSFFNNFGICEKKGEVFSVNKKGEIIKRYPNLLSHSEFKNGVAIVTEKETGNGKYGVIDANGNKLIECKYEYIEKISNDYYYVNNNKTGAGVISKSGDTILPLVYNIDYFDTTTLNFIGVNKEIGYGFFTKDGEPVKVLGKSVYSNSSYVEGAHFFQRDSLIIFKDKFSDDGTKYGVLNLKLDTIVPFGKYYYISEINEGLIKFSDSVTTDETGNRTNPYQYVKCGFLDVKGKVVITPKFDFAHYFTEGMSGVRINCKWGFIDRNGTIVIPLMFDYVLPFKNGYAKVKLKEKFYIINKAGKIVLDSKSY
jgi:hypothetical protein